MNKGRWIVGLAALALGAVIVAGCRVSGGTSSDIEATVQAAVEATVLAQGGAAPTQVVGVPIGPPAPTRGPAATTPQPGDVRRVSAAELKAMVDAGEVLVVDARVKRSYDEKHIAGSISMPYNTVAQRYTELPQDKHVSFY